MSQAIDIKPQNKSLTPEERDAELLRQQMKRAATASLTTELTELRTALERKTRKCANQRKELRRLNAKLRAVCEHSRILELRARGDITAQQSRAELHHEMSKLATRLRSARGEIERLRTPVSDSTNKALATLDGRGP